MKKRLKKLDKVRSGLCEKIRPLSKEIILGTSLVVAAGIFGMFFHSAKTSTRVTVDVNGQATKTVRSDSGTWQISFSKEGQTMAESIQLVEADEDYVGEYLSEFDVSEVSIDDTIYETTPVYDLDEDGNPTDVIKAYRSYAYIEVNLLDVDLLSDLYENSNDLILKGVKLGDSSPKYYYSGLNDLKLELLDDAMKNARKRAETIADGDGKNVNELISANQGVFQVNSSGDVSVSDVGNLDTSSIYKDVNAVVSASFELE